MTARLTADAILATIHNLADERFRLYRKPARCFHGAAGEHLRERIKALTRELDELWGVHRALLAAPHYRPRRRIMTVADDLFSDYLERAALDRGSPAALLDDLDGFTIDLLPIAQAVRRDYHDNPIPLREVLARRGVTLVWMNGHGGVGVERPVKKEEVKVG